MKNTVQEEEYWEIAYWSDYRKEFGDVAYVDARYYLGSLVDPSSDPRGANVRPQKPKG